MKTFTYFIPFITTQLLVEDGNQLPVWPEVNETQKIRDGLDAHNRFRSWHFISHLVLGT